MLEDLQQNIWASLISRSRTVMATHRNKTLVMRTSLNFQHFAIQALFKTCSSTNCKRIRNRYPSVGLSCMDNSAPLSSFHSFKMSINYAQLIPKSLSDQHGGTSLWVTKDGIKCLAGLYSVSTSDLHNHLCRKRLYTLLVQLIKTFNDGSR